MIDHLKVNEYPALQSKVAKEELDYVAMDKKLSMDTLLRQAKLRKRKLREEMKQLQ